jgi:multidrug efflux pump subunit AcrA (membrane-fusion protein)
MNRIEINVITGENKVIELTAEEVAQAQAQYAQWEAEKAQIETAKQAAEAAKQSALNKLTALELTPDEIKSLLGV